MIRDQPLISTRLRHVLPCLILGWTTCAGADLWSTLFPHDVDVITVTDMTDAGRAYPNATPAQPVYYKIIDLGYQPFGPAWSGESMPTQRTARKWLITAMAQQGYRLADEQHPPTQLLVFTWGMRRGDAVKFLGGEKMSWVQASLKVGIAGKVLDFAEATDFKVPELFLGLVRSYTMDSETAPKVTLLWETRFGCPAIGLAYDETMPLLLKAAAVTFGRETKMPVNLNASEVFQGRVDLGELKVLEYAPPAEKDGSKTDPVPPKPDSP